MPVYKCHSLHSHAAMNSCIGYITDVMKTSLAARYSMSREEVDASGDWNAHRFITAFGVSSLDGAAREMAQTRSASKRSRTHYGYHLIQSFAPDAPVTAELVHEIGCQMSLRVFPRHQAVVATHLNRLHLHNHIAASPVSSDTDEVVQYPAGVRHCITDLARYHGALLLPVYGLEETQVRTRNALEVPWRVRHWDGMREDVNLDIREAAARSSSRAEMFAVLQSMGYEVTLDRGKDALRPPGGLHLWHLDRFYAPWELRAMTEESMMRDVWRTEQSRIAAEGWPRGPYDTLGGRLTALEAALLFWARVLRQHDRHTYPEMPHQAQRELRKTIQAFRGLRQAGLPADADIDAVLADLTAQRSRISAQIRAVRRPPQTAARKPGSSLEELLQQRKTINRTITRLRDAQRAAACGLASDLPLQRRIREPFSILLPDH